MTKITSREDFQFCFENIAELVLKARSDKDKLWASKTLRLSTFSDDKYALVFCNGYYDYGPTDSYSKDALVLYVQDIIDGNFLTDLNGKCSWNIP